MKNSFTKRIYHSFVCKYYGMNTFRGGWMLAHNFYLDYKNNSIKKYFTIAKCHLKGWSYVDWNIIEPSKENEKKYLNSRDYCSLHPINGIYSSWIDDKLTLKYILNGTDCGRYMPNYYFLLEDDERFVPLMDVDKRYVQKGMDGFIQLINDKGILALKLMKGSLGEGFYKLQKQDDKYLLNEIELTEKELRMKMSELKGYLVMEFLTPHPAFAKYSEKSVGCLRYLLGRRLNGDLQRIYSFMRIGTKESGSVENFVAGGILMPLSSNGEFHYGYRIVESKEKVSKINVTKHPDNGLALEGIIPLWNEVENAAKKVADLMPQLSYMGIDFCLTDKEEVKILEINSLGSLDAFQIENSILDMPAGDFFKERGIKVRKS